MMRSVIGSYLIALTSVALVSLVASLWLPLLGLTSAALLYLLPVLLVSARGGIGPGLCAAVTGALAYNFFLLPPRFSLQIHAPENLVGMVVLGLVAIVTSRLATALRAREVEATTRAAEGNEAANFATLLGRGAPADGLNAALDWIGIRFGPHRLILRGALPDGEAGFSSLDLSAAAWAMHNGDMTGHGTAVMAAADWTCLPLAPRGVTDSDIIAVARPADGSTRSEHALLHMRALAQLLGQARDRIALDEEQRARTRLEDRDALHRTFLASMAHDFRTPLTVVTGELERLAQGDRGAADALMQAQRLHRMMEDLIGAARIEGGALVVQLEAVDLVDIVTDGLDALAGPLKPLRLSRDVAGDLPLVEADPVLLRHILINLLDNAARHAAASVSIETHVAGDHVELLVRDDGPGIPVAERARLFERFTQIEGGDRHGGSGLGLAIVKGFANAMGMKIGMIDGDAAGSTFCVQIPIRGSVHE